VTGTARFFGSFGRIVSIALWEVFGRRRDRICVVLEEDRACDRAGRFLVDVGAMVRVSGFAAGLLAAGFKAVVHSLLGAGHHTYDFRMPPIAQTINVPAPPSASSLSSSSSPPAPAPTAASSLVCGTTPPPASTPPTSSQSSQSPSLTNPTPKENCPKCDKPISGPYVRALGGVFHAPCFTCLVSTPRLPRLIAR
jgi:hypothetical protein